MRIPKHLSDRAQKRQHLGAPIKRTVFVDNAISRPSRGGHIVLEKVTALDFSFLGLGSVNPPMTRDPDQEVEDKFFQQLLLLGARWFDSWLSKAETEPALTLAERRWVGVGWPIGDEGGFRVAEYDTHWYG
ncbi:hypothetical protein GGS26DRAFT_592022 [Hypomontagnella submonticulosa]|nr:hypothetical protein GGS26DRAFT_592022 [Hypomontagnella submonticulosa]